MINLDFLSMLMVVAFGMIMMQGLGNLIQELLNLKSATIIQYTIKGRFMSR